MGFFDHYYLKEKQPTKAGRWMKNKQSNFILNKILTLYEKEEIKLLEIGAGKGFFAEECRKYEQFSYFGMEGNKKQSMVLKDKGFDIKTNKVPPINEESDSFDVVVMSNLLEHMDGAKAAINLIMESYRIIKKEGLIAIFVPDYLSWKSIFFDVDYTHNYVTTLRRIEQLIEDNSFSTVYQIYVCGPFVGNISSTLISNLVRFIYFLRIPYLFGWNNFLKTKIYKIRSSFLRSFLIVGRKVEHGKDGQ